MKKIKLIPILLSLSMTFLLGGCGGSPAIDNQPEPPITTANSDTLENDTAPKKSIVVYFSWSGNTQQMSQWIAEESGSDIYRVTPTEEYSNDYNACTDRARDELDNGIRPELDNLLDTEIMAEYDIVYVGFPIWWYDLPMPMLSFIENYDLSGKTIIPFFSHNGSSSGASSLDTLAAACPNSTVLTDEVLSIAGSSVNNSENEIREWVKNINIT